MRYMFLFLFSLCATTVKGQYSTTKIVDDGIYIEIGESRYLRLQETAPGNGKVVTMQGREELHHFTYTPCIGNLDASVTVTDVKKIILQGSGYTGCFSNQLQLSAIENFNAQHVTQTGYRVDSVKVLSFAWQFGSAYSSIQSPVLYVPEIERESLQRFVTLAFDTWTNSENSVELDLATPLEKGKTYALWNSERFWLFTID